MTSRLEEELPGADYFIGVDKCGHPLNEKVKRHSLLLYENLVKNTARQK